MKSLYQDLKDAGVEMDNHESDLYFPITGVSTAILNKHTEVKSHSVFINQRDKTQWYEAPFQYMPWWENRRVKI